MKRKGDLPTKTCMRCGRAFAWRRKWSACWEEVKYCSERCRRTRSPSSDRTKPASQPVATASGGSS